MGLAALACFLLAQESTLVLVGQAPATVAQLLVEVPWGDTELWLRGEETSPLRALLHHPAMFPSKGLMSFIFATWGFFIDVLFS